MSDPLFILAVLAFNIVLSEILVRRTCLKHLGTALLVIVITAATANLGVIPTYSDKVLVYQGVFTYLAPLAIFWLLLGVDLKSVLKAGASMIGLFLVGSLGTMLGVISGMWIINGETQFGELYHALGGMFTGTYTGGSINFNAIALHFRVVEQGILYAGATAVDAIMTTIWMAVTLVLPRILGRQHIKKNDPSSLKKLVSISKDVKESETIQPLDLGILLAAGAVSLFCSNWIAAFAQDHFGIRIPSILILTTIALIMAQIPAVARLRGARVLGMFSVYLFLAVIGALCDIHSLQEIGRLGTMLFFFATIIIIVHGTLVFGAAAVFRLDPDIAAVASQANIGGSTSALALAQSRGRNDLVLPAILVGALGNAIGTYLGFLIAGLLA